MRDIIIVTNHFFINSVKQDFLKIKNIVTKLSAIFPKDWFYFFIILFCISAWLTDEEPCFDITDLNVTHCVLLTISAASIIFDNVAKSLFGYANNLDTKLILFAVFFFNALICYIVIIWIGFFVHVQPALLVNLVEVFNYWIICSNAATSFILSSCIIFFFMLNILMLITYPHDNKFLQLLIFIGVIFLIKFEYNLVVNILSFQNTTITQISNLTNSNSFSKSSHSYNMETSLITYDWHITSNKSPIISFLDLASTLFIYVLFAQTLLPFIFMLEVTMTYLLYGGIKSTPTGYYTIIRCNATVIGFGYILFLSVFTILSISCWLSISTWVFI